MRFLDTSAGEVKAEFIWALPPAANDNGLYGGGDHISGYAPLALVAENASNQLELYWVHGNHLGVPVVTTNAQGQVVTPGNDFLRPGFPGQSEVLADLYYNRARDYDPVTGRYIQADPIGLRGDVNPYVYAGSDPVNGIDPLGLMTRWEHYTGLPDSYRVSTMNAIAGWSDGMTLGATWYAREWLGSNRDIGLCNDFYGYGGMVGIVSFGGLAKVGYRRLLKPNEGIYQFVATSGRTYVGQSRNITQRLRQHIAEGRAPADALKKAKRWRYKGGRVKREIAEQRRIDNLGGIRRLQNRRNPIGPKRAHLKNRTLFWW